MQKTLKQFDEIINKSKKIFIKKYKKYGSSWRILRIPSITDQIFIKSYRIRNIQDKGPQKIKEDISEDFLAIINYSIIGLIQIFKYDDSLKINISYNKCLKHYNKQIEKAKLLMEKKNHDYGEIWKKMRLTSITDIILQKILRIKNIENKKTSFNPKSLKCHYLDLLNYAVFGLIKIYKKKKKN